jgi:hypothetical protein
MKGTKSVEMRAVLAIWFFVIMILLGNSKQHPLQHGISCRSLFYPLPEQCAMWANGPTACTYTHAGPVTTFKAAPGAPSDTPQGNKEHIVWELLHKVHQMPWRNRQRMWNRWPTVLTVMCRLQQTADDVHVTLEMYTTTDLTVQVQVDEHLIMLHVTLEQVVHCMYCRDSVSAGVVQVVTGHSLGAHVT